MKVICFGDSNTYGYDPRSWFGGRYDGGSRWVDILREKTGWDLVNQGQNGREIPTRRTSFPAFPEDMDLLIVMLGINDLLQGLDAEKASVRMEDFLSGLDIAREKILLIAPPPAVPGEWVQDAKTVEQSQLLAQRYKHVAERLGVMFADAGGWGVSMAYDGVHFTEEGHKAFAEGIYNYLCSCE